MSEAFDDFDAFVAKHNITDDELGAAFAAWLGGKGWDGDFKKVADRNKAIIDKMHMGDDVP